MTFSPALLLATTFLAAASDGDALRAEHTYSGAGRPIMLQIAPPASTAPSENVPDEPASLTLVLLDPEGKAVGEPVAVRPGRIDLAEAFPEVWSIRRTLYLQALHGGEPRGSALVLQPMLAPLRPHTQLATRPDGRSYQRIVSWTAQGDQSARGEARRLFNGFRIYPERDVLLHTNKGEIRLAMRPDEAPNTVWNFLELVRGGFYRDIIFHRIVPLDAQGNPFVIQAGDPTGFDGAGGGGPGYSIDLEPSDMEHDFGVVSMARTDEPDSAGSQFFICLSRAGTGRLDGQYTAFGHAVSGTDVILAIADVELADPETGRPAQPPIIHSAELTPSPARVPGQGRPDERVRRPAPPPPDPHGGRIPR